MVNETPFHVDTWDLAKLFKVENYEPHAALAELIDNSVQACLDHQIQRPYKITMQYYKDQKRIVIKDEGIGFNDSTRDSSRLMSTDILKNNNLGKYNVGMKYAIMWLGDQTTIISKSFQESTTYKFYLDTKNKEFQPWENCASDLLLNKNHGTVTIIDSCRSIAFNLKSFYDNIVYRLFSTYYYILKKYTFHIIAEYIWGDNQKETYDLKEMLTSESPKMHLDVDGNEWTKNQHFLIHGINFALTWKILSIKQSKRINWRGFHFYYANRLIKTYPVELFTSNDHINKRLHVYVQVTHDSNVPVTHNKNNFTFTDEEMLSIIDNIKKYFIKNVKDYLSTLGPGITTVPPGSSDDSTYTIELQWNDNIYYFRIISDENSEIGYDIKIVGETYEVYVPSSIHKKEKQIYSLIVLYLISQSIISLSSDNYVMDTYRLSNFIENGDSSLYE